MDGEVWFAFLVGVATQHEDSWPNMWSAHIGGRDLERADAVSQALERPDSSVVSQDVFGEDVWWAGLKDCFSNPGPEPLSDVPPTGCPGGELARVARRDDIHQSTPWSPVLPPPRAS